MNVTVFCASSDTIPRHYIKDAQEMAGLLSEYGHTLVYGGGSTGIMGIMADIMLANRAKVKGVIPRFMVEVEWQHKRVSDMELTETMEERKQRLIELADVILVLPGGVGTLDEMFMAICNYKLKLHNKEIIILNTEGIYTPIQDLLQRMDEEHFLSPSGLQGISFVKTPAEVIEVIKQIRRK